MIIYDLFFVRAEICRQFMQEHILRALKLQAQPLLVVLGHCAEVKVLLVLAEGIPVFFGVELLPNLVCQHWKHSSEGKLELLKPVPPPMSARRHVAVGKLEDLEIILLLAVLFIHYSKENQDASGTKFTKRSAFSPSEAQPVLCAQRKDAALPQH